MEEIRDKIGQFFCLSSGYGSGYGDGSGDGSGYGDGSGDGYGDGSGDGYGSGDGSGDGYGDGSGDGYGSGYGYGSGSGYGDGSGSGSGSGSGIKFWNGRRVYVIDGVHTLISSVYSNYASGEILNDDFTLTPCYIAKVDNCFAHGVNLRKAFNDATKKAFELKPIESRIDAFVEEYPKLDCVAKNTDLFEWHNKLTGSCEMGRHKFAKDNNIDIEYGATTIADFIALVEHSYGADVIKQLKARY